MRNYFQVQRTLRCAARVSAWGKHSGAQDRDERLTRPKRPQRGSLTVRNVLYRLNWSEWRLHGVRRDVRRLPCRCWGCSTSSAGRAAISDPCHLSCLLPCRRIRAEPGLRCSTFWWPRPSGTMMMTAGHALRIISLFKVLSILSLYCRGRTEQVAGSVRNTVLVFLT